MPKLDGYQLCKIIKNSTDTKHIPVVMLSGKDGLFDKVRGKMAGCANYITKPFEPDLLISEVRKYVKPALIPMSPNKPKKKAPETPQHYNQTAGGTSAAHEDAAVEMRALSDQLAGLVLPDNAHNSPAANAKDFNIQLTQQAPAPISVRADDLPPLPEDTQPVPSPPQPLQRETPKPATVSSVAAAGTNELDKLLAELNQDDDIDTPARPREPFRSRCPGCRTVFRNVRPDDYDKHARCKKCGSRFHLGDHLVV